MGLCCLTGTLLLHARRYDQAGYLVPRLFTSSRLAVYNALYEQPDDIPTSVSSKAGKESWTAEEHQAASKIQAAQRGSETRAVRGIFGGFRRNQSACKPSSGTVQQELAV